MCKLSKEVGLTRDEFLILASMYEDFFDHFNVENKVIGFSIKSLLEKGLIRIAYRSDRYAITSEMKPLVCRVISLINSSLPGVDREDFHSVKFCHIDGVLDILSVQYWKGFGKHTKDLYVAESSEVDHANTYDTSGRDVLVCGICGNNPLSSKEESEEKDGVIKESIIEILSAEDRVDSYELESPTQVSDNHYRKMKIQATDIAEQIMENNLAVPVKSRYLVCMGIKHLIRLGLKKDNDWEKELKKAINYFVRALTGKWAWQVDLNELFERVK